MTVHPSPCSLIASVLAVVLSWAVTLFSSSIAAAQPSCRWRQIPLGDSHWQTEYDGFGQIVWTPHLRLKPRRAVASDETHAALVLLKEPVPSDHFGFRVTYENRRPLRRKTAPNPWEVLWVFFNYRGTAEQKQTNYLIFKPNGLELGKAWGRIDQEFLTTTEGPPARFGKVYQLSVWREKDSVWAAVDGQTVLRSPAAAGARLFDHAGRLGLYTEDADVVVHNFELCEPKTPL